MEHLITWDADAVLDFEGLKNRKERKSVYTVVDKLARTKFLVRPHAANLTGEPGLLELRPRAGASYVRPIYRQWANGFVILSVSIEPDKADFDKAIKNARARFARYDP